MLLLSFGAPIFRYYPYVAGEYIPEGLQLLHITDDPNESGKAPVGDSLLSSPVLALEALLNRVQKRTATPPKIPQQSHRMSPHPAAEQQEGEQL